MDPSPNVRQLSPFFDLNLTRAHLLLASEPIYTALPHSFLYTQICIENECETEHRKSVENREPRNARDRNVIWVWVREKVRDTNYERAGGALPRSVPGDVFLRYIPIIANSCALVSLRVFPHICQLSSFGYFQLVGPPFAVSCLTNAQKVSV